MPQTGHPASKPERRWRGDAKPQQEERLSHADLSPSSYFFIVLLGDKRTRLPSMSTIELVDPELRDALALWPLLDVYDDGQGVVGRDRAIGQNADRLCAKRALDMDLVGGDIGQVRFRNGAYQLKRIGAVPRQRYSAVSGVLGRSARGPFRPRA
jgi:hypothetical protein